MSSPAAAGPVPRAAAVASLLIGLGPEVSVIEVSADRGERALALRAAGAGTVACLRRVGFRPPPGVTGLSLGDGAAAAFDAAVVTLGGELPGEGLPALLVAVATALRPGGVLLVAASNPLLALPLVGRVAARLGVPGPIGWARPSVLARALRASGCDDVRLFAPLPHAARPKFLVPIADQAVVDYFLTHLMPRSRRPERRLLVAGARLLAWLGLTAWVVPSYQACGVKG